MIIKTLKALAFGVQQGTKATAWLMKDDIEQGKKLLNKTPYIKDLEFQSPIKHKSLKEEMLDQEAQWYEENIGGK